MDADTLEKSWMKVLNPTSIEQSILRTSLLPGLLQVVKYNWDHQNQEIAGFEVGQIHFKEGKTIGSNQWQLLCFRENRGLHHWDEKPKNFDFYDLKGMIENLIGRVKIEVAFQPNRIPMLTSWKTIWHLFRSIGNRIFRGNSSSSIAATGCAPAYIICRDQFE